MNTGRIDRAARVIHAAMEQGKVTAASYAVALDSAQLLMSPETAAELERLRANGAELENAAYGDAKVRLLHPVEQVKFLHSALAAQKSRADTLDSLLREKQAAETAPATVFRASHDSIVVGHYTTAAEARKHCETAVHRGHIDSDSKVSLWWREDEDTVDQSEDGEAELYERVTPNNFGGRSYTGRTGYVVTPLEVAAAYDEGADE